MVSDALRMLVEDRAGRRCEYCSTPQNSEPFFRYQVDHCISRQHGGGDDLANLALACPHCNFHKGPNIAGLDPATGALTPLFHPRELVWSEHFIVHRGAISGMTPIGRTTVVVLAMNESLRVELRLGMGAS